jgi:hypothetical protein
MRAAIAAVCPAHPRLHGEEFLVCAPAFNPAEQLCNDLKSHTVTGLLLATRALCRRLREPTLGSFILVSDLPSPPWH